MILTPEAVFSIELTLKIVLVNIILYFTVGNLLVFYLEEENTLLKKIVSFLIDLPLIFPPIVTGFILLWIFRKQGILGEVLKYLHIEVVFSFTGLVIAGFIASISLYVKPILSALRQFPKPVLEASYVSGKGKIYTFLRIVLPNIKNTFFVALLLSISKVLGEVGISLMLGGNIPFKTNTISLEIFTAVFNADLKTAFNLSIIMFIVSITFFFMLKMFEKKSSIKTI
jgi:molybdate transport system permease protein